MTKFQRWSLFLLRVALGWLFFYAGITKLMNSGWSAAGYLNSAKSFRPLFEWLGSPGMLPFVNVLNEWGLTLIGLALILGIFVRWSGILGAVLMLLYYLPLSFPKPNVNSFIVDEHIVYALALLVLAAYNAGKIWGLENWSKKLFKR